MTIHLRMPRQIAVLLLCILGATRVFAEEASAPPANPACIAPAKWAWLKGNAAPQVVTAPQVFSRLAGADVVLLGEQHDDEDHHRWQLQTISGLFALRPRLVIGLEMFPRRAQAALNRWVAGELNLRQFLEKSEWEKVWNVPFGQYLPIFQFARINRIPLVALNVDNSLNKAVIKSGWAAIPEAQREGVGTPAPPPQAYRDFLYQTFMQHRPGAASPDHGNAKTRRKTKAVDPAFTRFVESQTLWDRAMAEALAGSLALPGDEKPLVIGLMGSGHIRFGQGVAHQLAALGVTQVESLLPARAQTPCADLPGALASGVFVLPSVPELPPDKPRLGVRLEGDAQGVKLLDVTKDSLAEATGLLAGDLILAAGGQPAPNVGALIGLVRATPPGAWLPLTVRRGEETLEIIIRFPPKS